MLQPGTKLGPYEVLSSLGAGGMGEVYRARDTKLNRDVALKILPDAFANDPDRLARFTREAQTLAALNHPHIAHIHGLEESGAIRALVMELVEGEDLAQRIARGPMPPDEALPIAKQIAEALEAAHEHGIIHRDLKPANVKVRADGTVKVLDFGLAKAIEGAGGSGWSRASGGVSQSPTLTTPAMMTGVGVILGTAAYMAPEQAKGKPVDKRADIWAFGCVLYEMLTACQPFVGESVPETFAHVMTRDVDLARLPADVPSSVRHLIARCLVRDQVNRLRDIGEARIVLEGRAVAAEGPPAPQASSMYSRTGVLAVGVTFAAIAGVAGWWLAARARVAPVANPVRAVMDPRPALGFARSTLTAFTFTPNGRELVFAATADGGSQRLYRRQLDQPDAIPLAGTEGAAGPFISPDGAWVGFWASGAIKKVPLAGGGVVTIHDLRSTASADSLAMGWTNELGNVGDVIYGATWLPDDTIVYGRFAGGLWRIPASGGTPRPLTKTDTDAGELAHRLPHALPGGKALLFTVQSSLLGDRTSVDALVLQTGARRRLVEEAADGRYAGDGALVFARRGSLFSVSFDPQSLAVSREPVRVVPDVMHAISGNSPGRASGAAQFDVSPDRTLAFLNGGMMLETNWALGWVQKGKQPQLIDVEPRSYLSPKLSPDGQTIAVSGKGRTDAANALYLVDPRRAIATVLMKEAIFGVWMPDGTRLLAAFRKGGAEGQNIYAIPVAGGAAQRIVESRFPLWPSSVSVDGRWLAYVESNPTTGNDVWVVGLNPIVAPRPMVQTPANEAYPAFSPDGHLIAYTSTETGTPEIYAQAFPGGGRRVQISRGGGRNLSWTRDGTSILYLSSDGTKVMMVDVERGDAIRVGETQVFAEGNFAATTPVGGVDMARDGSLLMTLATNPPANQSLEQLQLVVNAASMWPQRRSGKP